MSRYEFPAYVSVAKRKVKALKKIKSLQDKGRILEPLGELSSPMKIATSLWGRAWCRHLESFSDYENRLPRGRSYVRHGSVLHLAVKPGVVEALVQGSELYELSIGIDPLPSKTWKKIKTRSQGKIGSLIELLQGKISDEIMAIVTDKTEGLFPDPKEIHLNCNCPDWAEMCKHVAAALYGIGARLDEAPELLFKLRGVDHHELIAIGDSSVLSGKSRSSRRRRLASDSLSSVFGIDLEPAEDSTPVPPPPGAVGRVVKKTAPRKAKASPKTKKAPVAKEKPKRKAAPKPSAPAVEPTAASLRRLRTQLALSRSSFARKLGVSIATLTKWEQSKGPLTVPKPAQTELARLQAAGKE